MSRASTENIIKENDKRLAAIAKPYNPILGEGSTACDRVECRIEDAIHPVLYLPKVMIEQEGLVRLIIKAGSFAEAANMLNKTEGDYLEAQDVAFNFVQIRNKYDFEFWAASNVYIKEKVTDKALAKGAVGKNILFVLNRGQRKLLKHLYKMWLERKPIRVILLKARQWGGSTLTQIFMMWLQIEHHLQWNSVICAHIENTAKIVRGMYDNALLEYPFALVDGATKALELRPYKGSTKTRILDNRGCRITIGSAEKPESVRGEDLCMAHFSEVGLFKATEGKKPEDLIQSIVSGIPLARDTMVVYESTAKGVGNFFHREWLRAKQGVSNYDPVFVAWFEIDAYSTPIDNHNAFIEGLTEKEYSLFEAGATLEQIAWYKEKGKEYSEEWRFVSEYPSNDIEAFQSTGSRYFNIAHVDRLRVNCTHPMLRADITAGDTHGERALENIKISENPQGKLSIWEMPDNDVKMINNRYVVVVDVNKGSSKYADNGIICVFDRYWMSEGGVPEVVAEWCGHIEMRYFMKKLQNLKDLQLDLESLKPTQETRKKSTLLKKQAASRSKTMQCGNITGLLRDD